MSVLLHFEKYQGLGNDFILFDRSESNLNTDPDKEIIKKLCDRHCGIGADGVLMFDVIRKNHIVEMVYYNADGSRAETCFNGLRCIALHAFRSKQITGNQHFIIKSDAGEIKSVVYSDRDLVEIELPGPDFTGDKIGLRDFSDLIDKNLSFPSVEFTGTALSMGNPHFISWRENLSLDELNREILEFGAEVEDSPHFLNGINFELVSKTGKNSINMAVWERGVGQTFACGSGATASVCAGVKTGRLEPETDIKVQMIGGFLRIRIHKGFERVTLKGEAKFVFAGEINLEDLPDLPVHL